MDNGLTGLYKGDIMKKTLVIFAALAALSVTAGEPAPTREWVRRLVANSISNTSAQVESDTKVVFTNGVNSITTGGGEYALRATWEDAIYPVLCATNVTQAGSYIAQNGTMWVWDSSRRRYYNSLNEITATSSGFVYLGFASTNVNGNTWFYRDTNTPLFSIFGTSVTASRRNEIIEGR